ncbi:FixH family protein [Mesobacillus subterraneus]|uniref:FixH family protein n=1 Tax=Mesobacillus subterraneus TaxID=285983 RepID=UPI00273FF4AD|nr:FixH family protein [Mesobacillus subterraneus]WLR55229.1 FixH family protein [Mesobacillus subterraneus]
MKKLFFSLFILLATQLTGCSQEPVWNVEINKEPVFSNGKESNFEIMVMEDGAAVKDLQISAEFAMASMDHGSINVELEEISDGVYSGSAIFSMAGEWEAVFTLEKDGFKQEKVINLNVKKAEGVASLNGEWITDEDLEFYQFINKLHIEINRETDREKYTGEKLDEALAYWDNQEKLNQDKNQLLTQIIRLRVMAMLGQEKGHKVTDEEVNGAIEKVRAQYSSSDAAKRLIAQFGEEKFWSIQQQQYARIVLTQKVQNDLIEKIKKENPKAGEQEVLFTAEKEYEELLVSQVNSLKIKIM